jgi:hypothetical protein
MRLVALAVCLLAVLALPCVGLAAGYGFLTTIGSGDDAIDVVYVGGSYYDMGYWYGKLLEPKVAANYDYALGVLEGLGYSESALLSVWAQAQPFIPTRYQDEMQGLADGCLAANPSTTVTLSGIRAMHIIPEADQVQCSSFAAFGAATADGHVYQTRNLDWTMDLLVQNRPVIAVCDPYAQQRYAMVSFAGMMLPVAGINISGLALGEISGYSSDDTYAGLPVFMRLRNVMEQARTLAEAVPLMTSGGGTWGTDIVIGDGATNNGYAFEISANNYAVIGGNETLVASNDPASYILLSGDRPALPIPDVVYRADVAFDSHMRVLQYGGWGYVPRYVGQHDPLVANWGAIDENIARQIAQSVAMSSCVISAIYDDTTQEMWVSFAHDYTPAQNLTYQYFNLHDYYCTYDDVSMLFWAYRQIEAMTREGITGGCSGNPPLFCPTGQVTRGQLAVFLCKAAGKTWLDKGSPTFSDVPRGSNGQWDGGGSGGLDADGTHVFYGWIERLADAASWGGQAPTGGCGSGRFCPSASATRGQMAAFLCKAAGKAWLDNPTPTFSDVPQSHPFYGWVERLADAASWGGTPVTTGCGTGIYCPTTAVPRGQMAVFLCRAFAIPY